MVAWPSVCRPTKLGGLGISDLRLTGFALQTRWLWLQEVDHDRAWSQLPISTAPEVQAFFRASTFTAIGDCRQALFWEDRWLNGDCISDIALYLTQLVSLRIRQRQTIREGLTDNNWVESITGARTTTAIAEYIELRNMMTNVQLSEPDKTIWRWTPDGRYSTKSAYTMLHAGATKFEGH